MKKKVGKKQIKREKEIKLEEGSIIFAEPELAGMQLEIKQGDVTDESIARLKEYMKLQKNNIKNAT